MAELPIAIADICIFQGATFNQTLFYETGEPSAPVNLAGYTAKMHIRSKPESKALILELSTSNGRIVLNEATGSIRLFISASDSALLSVCDKAVYDLELYDGAVTTRILQGNVIISPEVTR
jgi:tRNA A37 threonylcarbamoyltransferase TsaD